MGEANLREIESLIETVHGYKDQIASRLEATRQHNAANRADWIGEYTFWLCWEELLGDLEAHMTRNGRKLSDQVIEAVFLMEKELTDRFGIGSDEIYNTRSWLSEKAEEARKSLENAGA